MVGQILSEPGCIIIGASHAGAQAAVSLRQEGWQHRILVIGEEPHLPYNRPPLSKTFLSGEKNIDDLLIRPEGQYEKVGIDFMLGQRVERIDRDNKLVFLANGLDIPWRKLVLAMGSRVRTLDLPGADLRGVLYLRDIGDVERIRSHIGAGKKVVIVGGGYIGLETAAMLRQIGLAVTVLEAADRVLNRVTAPELSRFYTRVHEEEGAHIVTGAGVSGFVGDKRVREVTCSDGSTYPADLVIVGIGVIPNTEMAVVAGLDVDNGICVDEQCLTSDRDIAAVGDCTSFYNAFYQRRLRLESVQNAMDQARAAAAALCGKSNQYNALPWFWSDQYDMKLQIAGLSEAYDDLVLRGDPESGRKFAAFYYRGERIIAVDAVNSPQEFMIGKQLISQSRAVDKSQLRDKQVPIKSFLPSQSSAGRN